MLLKGNYYISSFFWSTCAKILNALFGFISIPLLLGVYGKSDYGILSIATACNGYMHLLDMGMNVGAVKYFSQWKVEGRKDLLLKVAHTNITFYTLIAVVNVLLLVGLAIFGEGLFSISHGQFLQLRECLYILALFAFFSWVTTAFNQLLVADKQLAFTMKCQCLQVVLKFVLVAFTLWLDLSLTAYFFSLTFLVAALIIPYSWRCLRKKLIDNLHLGFYWSEFRQVLLFSLSIFALSLFQATSTQSRPLILGIFALDGAESVADFRIIEVFPTFIISVGGIFTSMFLHRTSELVVKNSREEINRFAYRGTILTSVIANMLCIPLILGDRDILCAFVGSDYGYLSVWLGIWVVCVLLQIHSTPANALIMAYGKTKLLVLFSAAGCIVSIFINALLARYYSVGSAVIGYSVYILITLLGNYAIYYKRLGLSRGKMVMSFMRPTLLSVLAIIPVTLLDFGSLLSFFQSQARINFLSMFLLKALVWLGIYLSVLVLSKTVCYKDDSLKTCYDHYE